MKEYKIYARDRTRHFDIRIGPRVTDSRVYISAIPYTMPLSMPARIPLNVFLGVTAEKVLNVGAEIGLASDIGEMKAEKPIAVGCDMGLDVDSEIYVAYLCDAEENEIGIGVPESISIDLQGARLLRDMDEKTLASYDDMTLRDVSYLTGDE